MKMPHSLLKLATQVKVAQSQSRQKIVVKGLYRQMQRYYQVVKRILQI